MEHIRFNYLSDCLSRHLELGISKKYVKFQAIVCNLKLIDYCTMSTKLTQSAIKSPNHNTNYNKHHNCTHQTTTNLLTPNNTPMIVINTCLTSIDKALLDSTLLSLT